MASSLLGKTYGQYGSGLPIAVSAVAILMGLNLLEVLPLQLPSLNVDTREFKAPPSVQVCVDVHVLLLIILLASAGVLRSTNMFGLCKAKLFGVYFTNSCLQDMQVAAKCTSRGLLV